MDEITIWIEKKKNSSGLSEIPINETIEKYISETEKNRLNGNFYAAWENEQYTNSLILELLFTIGRIKDSNSFAKTVDITQEQQRLIDIEYAYKKALNDKEIRNTSLNDDYFTDLLTLGRTVAKKNKADKEKINERLDKEDDIIIANYTNEVNRVKSEHANSILISKQRAKEKEEAAKKKILKDKQDAIKANINHSKKNETLDTPMTIYMRDKIKADTANEMNESTQSTYKHDLVYLFFKFLMFLILGGVFYYLMKDQNTTEIINQVKETTKVVSDKLAEGVKSMKETIKEKKNEIIKS